MTQTGIKKSRAGFPTRPESSAKSDFTQEPPDKSPWRMAPEGEVQRTGVEPSRNRAVSKTGK
jgi:hypothetical protein